jgi:hypothetical protein
VVLLARVQRVEIGDAIDAEDHGFAVDHELASAPLPRSMGSVWSSHNRRG